MNDTLKAHDEWLQNSANHAIGDSNQKEISSSESFSLSYSKAYS